MNNNSLAEFEEIINEDSADFKSGFKDCIPTLLGYLSIGFAAGIVEKTAGMSILEIFLMGSILYTGSAQFIASAMIMSNSPISSTIFTIFLVNLRHILLSATLTPYFKHLSKLKAFIVGSELTDETFAVSINKGYKDKIINYKWMLGLNITAHINWVIANVLGGVFGGFIKNPENLGLEFALPAMFIGLLVTQLVQENKYFKNILIILTTVSLTLLLSKYLSSNISVIIATVIGATIGVLVEEWK